MYKERNDDMIYTGPVWDFDLAFENDNRTYPIMNKTDYIYRSGGSCAGNMKSFVDRIVVNDAASRAQLLTIWDEVRQGGLTEEYLVSFIDQMEQTLDQSQQLNFTRWPIMKQKVHQNPKVWGSYAAEVQNVRRYIKERITWMDNKLGYTYEPPSSVTVPRSTPNEQPCAVYSLQGRYCGNSFQGLSSGTYIVVQNQKAHKVVVR